MKYCAWKPSGARFIYGLTGRGVSYHLTLKCTPTQWGDRRSLFKGMNQCLLTQPTLTEPQCHCRMPSVPSVPEPALNKALYLPPSGQIRTFILQSRSIYYPGSQLDETYAVQLNGRTKTALMKMKVIMLSFLCFLGTTRDMSFAPSHIYPYLHFCTSVTCMQSIFAY